MDRDWVGLGHGLFLGLSLSAFCGAVFFLGDMVFFFSFFFSPSFYVIGGSGVLSDGFCLWIFPFFLLFFLFSKDIGTFLYTEHDLPYCT